MTNAIALELVVRGFHDVFAAIWAGGLLVMALAVIPTSKSIRRSNSGGDPQNGSGQISGLLLFMARLQGRLRKVVFISIVGVFVTGVLLLRLSLFSSGGLNPRSLYGALLIAKIVLSLVMVAIAAVRAGKLRRLGDSLGDARDSGIPLLFANASLAVVVLLLSGAVGAIGP